MGYFLGRSRLKVFFLMSNFVFRQSLKKDAISVPSQQPRSRQLSAPSNLHRSALSPNPGNQANFGLSKTYPSLMFLATISPQSTARSILIFFHAPGAHSQLCHCSSGDSHPFRGRQYEMSKKHTEQSPLTRLSGQDLLSAWMKRTPSQSTPAIALDSHPGAVAMALSETRVLNSCEHVDSAQSRNGSVTICLYESKPATLNNTMSTGESRQLTLPKMEESCKMEVVCGSKVGQCPTTYQRSLSKTAQLLSGTIHMIPHGNQTMRFIPIVWPTLTEYPRNWASHGRRKKMFPSAARRHLRDSSGISRPGWYKFPPARKNVTLMSSSTGKNPQNIHSKKSKNSTESFYMRAKWFQLSELTSPAWKNSWPSSITVLSCRIPNLAQPQLTSSGGSKNYHNQPSADPSLAPTSSSTSQRSQMLARKWVSALSLAADGGHGASSWMEGRRTRHWLGRSHWVPFPRHNHRGGKPC